MAHQNERKYEIYDADADVDFTENSMIADYSVIERQMEADHGSKSLIQPTLPSGQVIDYKNTMQSYDHPIDSSVATPTTSHVSFHPSTNASDYVPASFSSGTKRQLQYSGYTNSAGEASASSINHTEEIHAVAIVEGKLYSESAESPRPVNPFLWVVATLLIVVAIVITGVCASGKCSAKSDAMITKSPSFSPSFSPSTDPTMSPTTNALFIAQAVTSFVNSISYFDRDILLNGTTPESRALKWLIEEDPLFTANSSALLTLDPAKETNISFRVRQRYFLATLYHQQTDMDGNIVKGWFNSEGWLEYKNECNWYRVRCETVDLGENVGEQNIVTNINFYNISLSKEGNDFYGSIPPDIGLLTGLTYLDLGSSSNTVTGSLPESLVNLSKLNFFDVSIGVVEGQLPSLIGQMTELLYFDASENQLGGPIPNSTKQWVNLLYFNIAENEIRGPLPDFIGNWTALLALDVSHNDLIGTIPESIGLLPDLISLDLADNKLTGTLPSSIGNLAKLRILEVYDNRLNGTIPESYGSLSQIHLAIFSNNELTGSVSSQLCSLFDPQTDSIYVDCKVNCTCCKSVINCTNGNSTL